MKRYPGQWLNLAADYSRATQMPCRVLYLEEPGEEATCSICDGLHDLFGQSTSCSELHLFSAYQSERWDGRYIYECPMAGTYWISPLMSGGMMTAALAAGPVLLNSPDDFLLDILRGRFSLDPKSDSELRELLGQLPVVSPVRVSSLSEMLRATAMKGSDRGDLLVFDDDESILQQARFGDYVHLLTSMEGDKNSDLDYPLDLEKSLLTCVSRGDKSRAESILGELMSRVVASTGSGYQSDPVPDIGTGGPALPGSLGGWCRCRTDIRTELPVLELHS